MFIKFKCPHCQLRQGDEVDTYVEIEHWHSDECVEVGEPVQIICPTCKTPLEVSLDIQLR